MASSRGRSQPSAASVGGTANEKGSRRKDSAWLTVDEICEELDIHRRTWQKWRTRNQTPELHRLPNGELRIHRDDYKAWLAELKVQA
jgi:excisionase family DNA binding protein